MEASRVEDSVIQGPYRVILGCYAGILENKWETTGIMGGYVKAMLGLLGQSTSAEPKPDVLFVFSLPGLHPKL